ncbi:hypothetical protein S245_043221, partial [Arachis hypogaea]
SRLRRRLRYPFLLLHRYSVCCHQRLCHPRLCCLFAGVFLLFVVVSHLSCRFSLVP